MMEKNLLTAKDIDKEIPLTPDQEYAAGQLAMGKSTTQVGEELGIGGPTISSWTGNTQFMALVEEQRRWLSIKLRGRLLDLSDKALDTLKNILDGPDEKLAFQAAKEVLRQAITADNVTARTTKKSDDDEKKDSIPPVNINLIQANKVGSDGEVVETEVKVIDE